MKQAEMLCAINNSVGARVQRLENTAVSAPLNTYNPFRLNYDITTGGYVRKRLIMISP